MPVSISIARIGRRAEQFPTELPARPRRRRLASDPRASGAVRAAHVRVEHAGGGLPDGARRRTRSARRGGGRALSTRAHLFVGLGARVRLRPSMYLVGEYSPRLAGHDPGRGVWGGAIEMATRGHTFQINFTNSFGTTLGQIARGGSEQRRLSWIQHYETVLGFWFSVFGFGATLSLRRGDMRRLALIAVAALALVPVIGMR